MAELRRRRFSAVVAVNDSVGLAVMAARRRRGIDVPAALSITGFDDIDATRLVRPRLTTVTVDKPAMGRLGTAVLRHRIDRPGDPPVTVLQRARLPPSARRSPRPVVRRADPPLAADRLRSVCPARRR